MVPEDYIHRVGRTARAEATGEAFTFVSPQEESDLRAIESAIGKRLPRVTVPDFDYAAKIEQKLEVPLAERIAAIRKKKSEERARAALKNARAHGPRGTGSHPRPDSPHRPKPAGSGGSGGQAAGAGERGPGARPGGARRHRKSGPPRPSGRGWGR
jgi:ATP-dependent RNA helicase RhlE